MRRWWQSKQHPDPQTRLDFQIKLILDEYGDDVELGPQAMADTGSRAEAESEHRDEAEAVLPSRLLFRRGHILVRDEYLPAVRALLGSTAERRRHGDGQQPAELRGIAPGVSLLSLPRGKETLEAISEILDALGPGVAEPDHLVSITSNGWGTGAGGLCPATEPERVSEWTAPEPGVTANRAAGQGVRVAVVDTGFDAEAATIHQWLNGVSGESDPAIGKGQVRKLDPYAGHGTFIAGVVRSMAPSCQVFVRAAFRRKGTIFESKLVRVLYDVLSQDYPDIITMSAGTETHSGTGLLSYTAFANTLLTQQKGVAIVTAAGNNSSSIPFWPAATPWAIGVGALATDSRSRASFSNFGGWVDVYAPGTDLINAFPKGEYTYHEPPLKDTLHKATFEGMARWSGTSFSTPLVAGLIAARMSQTGENAHDAAAALAAQAKANAIPGVGPILLP